MQSRRRGAQPGNHNAAKHGLYSRQLSPAGRQLLEAARELSPDDLAEEIALLRARVAVLLDAAPDRVDLVTAALKTLAQLIATNHRLSQAPQLPDALGQLASLWQELEPEGSTA